MVAVIVVVSIVIFLSIEAIGVVLQRRRARTATPGPVPVRAFGDIRLPRGLFVGEGHGWARLAESGEFRVGMDELLTQALGGADRLDLPAVGTRATKGQPLATVWRLGRKLTVTSPVNGTVLAVNDTVKRYPAALDADPYGSGWLVTVLPVETSEALKEMRVGERAAKWLRREVQRFVEFLTVRTAPDLVGATLPDGAHPLVGAALALDDQAWAEFQREFAGAGDR